MTEHRSPDNPDIIVVEPQKRTQEEIDATVQREKEISKLKGELMRLY